MKKYWYLPVIALLICAIILWKNNQWMHLDKRVNEYKKTVTTDQSENYEPSKFSYIGPTESVENFFGFSIAERYDNLSSFFEPDISLAYFYQDATENGFYERSKKFGEMLTKNGNLKDVKLIEIKEETLNNYVVKVVLKYENEKVDLIFSMQGIKTPEKIKPEIFITTPPEELIKQILSKNGS
ncbi:hypothetical protein DZB91_24080 [Brevibacillus sp. VP]|uniref:hypothetical protein n=1 Tax=Brevibacillus sp. VP TaxID=2293326 RepID=UPI000E2F7DC3|nr:hypothetical protein [Brevibacillus sp. VP]RFB28282.1 hypothetical protein DZB91_24080 [Brevibacillus sp. VP]